MKERFIPIEVYGKDNKKEIWYIDISSMSLSQLTEFRKELIGTNGVRCFDRIINDIIRSVTYQYINNKQRKRERKYNNMLVKRKTSNFKKGRR